jgi:hypothetical protein
MRLNPNRAVARASALTMTALLSCAANATCRVEASLPEAYSRPAADLQQPQLVWPELRTADDKAVQPTTATHGQLMLGHSTIHLYHLPVFMTNPAEHPHNFQVILEVAFTDAAGAARRSYLADREANPTSLYTATPAIFAQTALALEYPGRQPLRHFDQVAVFRGHFERQSEKIASAPMAISRVLLFRGLAPGGQKPANPSYLLFGRGEDMFLAHLLSTPPDFDQVLAVSVEGGDPGAAPRYLTFTDRANEMGRRLRVGDTESCTGEGGNFRLRVRAESYCEAGEVSRAVGADGRFAAPRSCP